jgi:nicotinamide phosphoribosyltransferase
VTVNGAELDVFKQPVTDPAKKSKAGRLKLVQQNNTYQTVPQTDLRPDQLRTVFRNGTPLAETTFNQIRKLAV